MRSPLISDLTWPLAAVLLLTLLFAGALALEEG